MTTYVEAAEELRPNPKQWEAYETTGNCVILAGPGSGKTKVLTLKLARLLSEEVQEPRGIACVTYSTECARELRRRLDRLGVVESRNLFVGTLHAFCLQHVLLPFGAIAGTNLPAQVAVAGINQQRKLFHEARKALGMGEIRELQRMMEVFRRDHLEREEWDLSEDVARLANEYEQRLDENGLLDFDAMIRDAVLLVERNGWVTRCLKARFPILLVDEYQDLGLALHRLVLKLCFYGGTRLVAVGDPDQSIYGFTGAHPEHLETLSKRHDVTAVRLALNYRSGPEIVHAVKATLTTTTEYSATRGTGSIVAYPGCKGGIDGQTDYLVKDLLPDVLQRWRRGDILISFRSKNEGDPVGAALRQAGYEYVKIGSTGFYPKSPLTRFVEECARWCSGGWEQGEPKVSRLARTWISLQRLVDPEDQRLERLKLVRFLFDHRTENGAAAAWVSAFESTLMMQNDARTRLLAGGDVECFDELLEALRPGGKLEEFTVKNLGGQVGSPEHINLVTLHSSKGTEFPVVILVGADEGSFPWASVQPGSPQEAEDRRLFYVGISRAMDELYILWSPPVPGDRSRQGPSRYLREMHERSKEAAT